MAHYIITNLTVLKKKTKQFNSNQLTRHYFSLGLYSIFLMESGGNHLKKTIENLPEHKICSMYIHM